MDEESFFDQEAYDSLIFQQQDTENQISSLRNQNDNLDEMISRLENAKIEISDVKENFRQIKKSTDNIIEEKYEASPLPVGRKFRLPARKLDVKPAAAQQHK